jgi:hypothetical protein
VTTGNVTFTITKANELGHSLVGTTVTLTVPVGAKVKAKACTKCRKLRSDPPRSARQGSSDQAVARWSSDTARAAGSSLVLRPDVKLVD